MDTGQTKRTTKNPKMRTPSPLLCPILQKDYLTSSFFPCTFVNWNSLPTKSTMANTLALASFQS